MTESKTTRNENKGNAALKRLEKDDEMTQRINETSTKLNSSNVISASFVKVLADLMNSKKQNHFSSAHSDVNRFTIYPHNTKKIMLLEYCLTFYVSDGIVVTYNLTNKDPN